MTDNIDTNSIDSSDSDRPTTRSSLNKETSGNKEIFEDKNVLQLKKLNLNSNKFMENFNPETSARERRKLNRKIINVGTKKHQGAVYDDEGKHLTTKKDLCDCLSMNCPGCFFPCPKCSSLKCGLECRNGRKYMYESIEYEGCNIVLKNILAKLNVKDNS